MGPARLSTPLRGTLKEASFQSQALGIEKRYFIYLPPRYSSGQRFPVVYLFRGHEKEWQDRQQDKSRSQNACDVAEELFLSRTIKEMILVMPSTSSEDGTIITGGVNLRAPELLRDKPGIGTGAFEDYLFELIEHIDATYNTQKSRQGRAVDGFSMGGFTALLLALKRPELFCSVGSYDGSFGFWRKLDPRKGARAGSDAIFDPFPHIHGQPFDPGHHRQNNPADLILAARGAQIRNIRALRFHLYCAGAPEPRANRDRTLHIISLLSLRGVSNIPTNAIFDPRAEHTWHWADEYLKRSLVSHNQAFCASEQADEAAA